MMLDDRDLARRFAARAERFPEPPAALFAATAARIDALTQQPARAARTRLRFDSQLGFAAALAATFVLTAGLGIQQLVQQHAQFAPLEQAEYVKIDRPPAAVTAPNALAPGVPAAQPTMIKINTLKTTSRPAGGPVEAPAPPAAVTDGGAIARAETLGLLVRDVPAAIATLTTIARRGGGFVSATTDALPDDPAYPRTATVTLKVAAPRLDDVNAQLLTLGALQSRTATAEAIGDSIVDDRARLRNLRRAEADLLHIMDRSGTVADVLSVESQLSDVRGQIEQLNAQLATSAQRVATAQIDITLTESRPSTIPATPTFGDHVSATWRAALHSIATLGVGAADLMVWAVAYSPVLIAIAAGFAALVIRRRSRF